jgi:inner membrane protein
MLWGTHLLFGLGVVSFFTLNPVALSIAAVISILPDLDAPFGHRQWFSHSFSASAIFSATGFIASSFNFFYAAVIFLSASIHILLDSMTKSGVPLFHPWKKKAYGLRFFISHNRFSNALFMFLGLFMLFYNIFGFNTIGAVL